MDGQDALGLGYEAEGDRGVRNDAPDVTSQTEGPQFAVDDASALPAGQNLTDGARTVQMHKIATSHSDYMIVIYLPNEKLLFNTDLLGPRHFPLPRPPPFPVWAAELLDEVTRLGLDVARIATAPGTGTATLADLLEAAGRGP